VSLPARERKVLERIEIKLRGSDPRLAAMFTIFSRLAHEEEMPRIEQLRHRAAMLLAMVRPRLAAVGRRRARIGPRHQMAVFFPLALVLMTAAIVLVARFGGTGRCAVVSTVATAKPHPRSKLAAKNARRCRPLPPALVPMGR
jgi:hypothetical protein